MDINSSYNSGNGSFQDNRLSALLLNDYIEVDERGLPELLLALRAYAENINFYDLDGQLSGHWLDLLLSDDSVFLATSISINFAELNTCFYRELSKGLAQAITENLHHIKWIDSWFRYAEKIKNHEGAEVNRKIRHMIQYSLVSAVTDLIRFDQVYNESSMFDPETLHPVWKYDHESIQRDTLKQFGNREQREQRLTEIFNSILNVLSLLRQESAYALEKSLTQQSHSPATGLILSFLKAYGRSQDKINSFSDRLLEYYYSTIQKNKPARGGGDRVYLECRINPDSEPVFIPAGSQFTAGKTDDLQDILYTSVEDNVISGAKLKALKTLFLQRHLLISPENFTRSITAVKASDVLQHFKNKDTSKPHSVFGYDDGCSGFSLGEDSDVGLVISSRLLDLKEGARKVTLEFNINDRHLQQISSDNEIKQILRDLRLQQGDKSAELAKLSLQYKNKFINFISNDEEKNLLQQDLLEAFKKIEPSKWSANKTEKREDLFNELYKVTLMTLLKCAISLDTFFNVYHQLISRHMLIKGFISNSDRKDILNTAVYSFGLDKKDKQDYERIKKQTKLPSQSLFVHYFHNAFALSITAETGWIKIDRYALSHLQKKNGFLISFNIGRSMPAIVNFDNTKHTGSHQTGAPALMIRINPDCNIFPYSYIQVFNIAKVRLKVEVKGYKSLIVQNDHGLVDRSKPFLPFGPAPVQGASCYIGGYEFAKKNVSKIILKICWKNLPENYAGFSGYYEGYAESVKNSDFKALISMSSGGSWIPNNKKRQQVVELFDSLDSSGILLSSKRIEVNLGGRYSTLHSDVDENQFIDMNQLKNGYLKLKLSTGYLVFGHKNYPRVMGSALTHNAKSKNKVSLPEEPYTPEIESISIDYSAEEFIKLTKPSGDKGSPHKNSAGSASLIKSSAKNAEDYEPSIYYLTPMGIELIHQQAASTGASFFPQWSDDGNLYIGYEKNEKINSFNLYFNLKNDSSKQTGRMKNTVHWFYYSASGWKCLNNHMLLFDSTNGLRQSGIVTIKLPEDSCIHTEMVPENLFWLRVSTTKNIDAYSSITEFKFDTLILQSVEDTTRLTASHDGYSKSWRSLNNIPGIQTYEQQQIAYDNKNSESREQAITRFYERLRHKNRAITIWDYERLVLEKFPQLYMVKCFSATSKKQLTPSPGHVLVVVVPKVVETDSVASQGYLVNAVEIKKIEDYLEPLMPANIKLEVSNPCYEIIQIRCVVKFSKKLNTGQFVKKLNQAISDYISPWSGKGYGVKFDWTIRKKDIESYILDLPYVSDVSRFSIIDVFMREEKPKKYSLIDSAAERIKTTHSNNRSNDDISSNLAWSLAISAKSHYIEVIDSEKNMLNLEAEPVGISNISIGGTFIINGTRAISEGNNSDVIA